MPAELLNLADITVGGIEGHCYGAVSDAVACGSKVERYNNRSELMITRPERTASHLLIECKATSLKPLHYKDLSRLCQK